MSMHEWQRRFSELLARRRIAAAQQIELEEAQVEADVAQAVSEVRAEQRGARRR